MGLEFKISVKNARLGKLVGGLFFCGGFGTIYLKLKILESLGLKFGRIVGGLSC